MRDSATWPKCASATIATSPRAASTRCRRSGCSSTSACATIRRTSASCSRACGRAGCCSTTASRAATTRPSRPTQGFIDRYVFPDGELTGSGRIITEAQDAGLEVLHEENLRPHYALTLRDWCANLVDHWDDAVAEVGLPAAKIWGLYMAGSRLAFETGGIQLHHVLAVRPDGTRRRPASCRCGRGGRPDATWPLAVPGSVRPRTVISTSGTGHSRYQGDGRSLSRWLSSGKCGSSYPPARMQSQRSCSGTVRNAAPGAPHALTDAHDRPGADVDHVVVQAHLPAPGEEHVAAPRRARARASSPPLHRVRTRSPSSRCTASSCRGRRPAARRASSRGGSRP